MVASISIYIQANPNRILLCRASLQTCEYGGRWQNTAFMNSYDHSFPWEFMLTTAGHIDRDHYSVPRARAGLAPQELKQAVPFFEYLREEYEKAKQVCLAALLCVSYPSALSRLGLAFACSTTTSFATMKTTTASHTKIPSQPSLSCLTCSCKMQLSCRNLVLSCSCGLCLAFSTPCGSLTRTRSFRRTRGA